MPIILTGKEIGEYAYIEELRKIAREEYRKLQGQTVTRDDLGEIRFTRTGFDKFITSGANPDKYLLLSKLKELIETACHINTAPGAKPGIIASHWLENDVILGGKHLRIGITILEDPFGNKFYNLYADLQGWGNKKYSPVLPVESSTGSKEYINNITDN